MSKVIIHCLGPFRKPDCKLGKITNPDDFKHLARKVNITSHTAQKVIKL